MLLPNNAHIKHALSYNIFCFLCSLKNIRMTFIKFMLYLTDFVYVYTYNSIHLYI